MKHTHCNAQPAPLLLRNFRHLLTVLSAVLFCVPSHAIVIRHDRADHDYVVDAAQYPALFHLHIRNDRRVCLATLISPRWAITAGHCIDDTPIRSTLAAEESYRVQLNTHTYQIVQIQLHPEYRGGEFLQGVDLALLELDRDVEAVTPVSLNHEQNETSNVAMLLGWGYTGIGTTANRYNDGKFRRAENKVDTAERWLLFNFDDPREVGSLALQLEGVPGLGDSGGPALLQHDDQLRLLGVAVGELVAELEVELDQATTVKDQGMYGATEVYERISLHLDWIESIIGR